MAEIKNLTICIKTLERPEELDKCLKSIRKYYPKVRIIVADDSRAPSVNSLADEYYFLEHDVGVSAGRNFLIDKVDTKYCMFIDDDTLFTNESRIERALDILDDNKEINMVAGTIKGTTFHGLLEKRGEIMIRHMRKHRRIINGHKIYDFDIQIFIARTETMVENKWNENLKTVEHTEYFWRAIGNIVLTRIPDWRFLNTAARNTTYSKYRVQRIREYMKKQCDAMGVERIVDHWH